MLNSDPTKRPDADKVLNDPWIQKGKEDRNNSSPIKGTQRLGGFRAWCKLQ